MTRSRRIRLTLTLAGITSIATLAVSQASENHHLHAVIIQAAGCLPGVKLPEGTDAITHATTQPMNTSVCTSVLTNKLTELHVDARIVDFTESPNLECLCPRTADGHTGTVDIVVFAGPAYFSKQPEQLQALFPKLSDIVRSAPHMVCTALIPAWYPDSKGVEAAKYTDSCLVAAGAKTVLGVSVLSSRKKNPGISTEALESAMASFAAKLVGRVEENRAKDAE